MKTFENATRIYDPVPTKVVFLYGCKSHSHASHCIFYIIYFAGWQNIYNQLLKDLSAQGITVEFKQDSTITNDDLEAMADPDGGQTLIVIDDNSVQVSESKDIVEAITRARHHNCSIVLLLHFIFGSQNLAKIRGNVGYYFLLKSCENAQQVALLGSKMGMKHALVKAYEKESRKPYGYVLVDRRTTTPMQHRIRTDIFGDQETVTEPMANEQPLVVEEQVEPPQECTPPPEKRVWIKWKDKKPVKKKKIIKQQQQKKKKKKKKVQKQKPKEPEKENPWLEPEKENPWFKRYFLYN